MGLKVEESLEVVLVKQIKSMIQAGLLPPDEALEREGDEDS